MFCALRVVDGMRLGGDAGRVDCMQVFVVCEDMRYLYGISARMGLQLLTKKPAGRSDHTD